MIEAPAGRVGMDAATGCEVVPDVDFAVEETLLVVLSAAAGRDAGGNLRVSGGRLAGAS